MRAVASLGHSSALLAVRGATNSVCTGALLQVPDVVCPFCTDATDSLALLLRCRRALAPFCEALGCAAPDALTTVSSAEHPRAARIWATYVGFVSTMVESQADIVARSTHFVAAAAGALVRAHLRKADETSAPRRRPRQRPRPVPDA